MPLSTSPPGAHAILFHGRKECLIIFNQWTWHLARQRHLGGSNTICLLPGASCSGGCQQNTLGYGFPLLSACQGLPLGSLQCQPAAWAYFLPWFASHPCYLPGKVLHNPSSQVIYQATQGPASNNSVSKYKCHPNPKATDLSITINQPNVSADFSPTENGLLTAAGQPLESRGQPATESLKQWEGRRERNASGINHQAV